MSVLLPEKNDNFYKEFRIVDDDMWKLLLQSKIVITNWHNLSEKTDSKKNPVLKLGKESNEAFCKRVLREFGGAKNILVINNYAVIMIIDTKKNKITCNHVNLHNNSD